MNLDALEKEAKQEINKIRKEHGLRALGKIKRGIPRSLTACPVVMSLEETGLKNALEVPYTQCINSFMAEVDRGNYPHLEIARKKPIKIKGVVVIPSTKEENDKAA